MKTSNITFIKIAFLGFCLIPLISLTSCKKQKEEKVMIDHALSEKWNNIFIDASKVLQVGEIKNIVFENPYDVNRCIIVRGGSSIATTEEHLKEYTDSGIPVIVAEKLSREYMGEGVRMFFLKDATIRSSIILNNVDAENNIYYVEIDKNISASIQIIPQLTERIKKDPNFLNHHEFGRDYLTNPERPKPIEIVKIE